MKETVLKYGKYILLFCIFGIIVLSLISKDNKWGAESEIDTPVLLLNEFFQEEEQDGIIQYTGRIPKEYTGGNELAFYTSHNEVQIYADGELIYSLTRGNSLFKSTGYVWNSVLMDEYKEAEIQIVLQSVLVDSVLEPNIYLGFHSAILKQLLHEDNFKFLMSLCLLVLGFAMLGYSLIFSDKKRNYYFLQCFASFMMMLGMWYICDSVIAAFLISAPIFLMILTHISLMIMPTHCIRFLRESFLDTRNKAWDALIWITQGIIIVRIVLQITRLADLRETLWMTHITIALLVVVGVYLSIKEMATVKMTKYMKTILFSILIIMLATLFDLVNYFFTRNSGTFGVMGFLIYALIMGIDSVKRSKRIYEKAKEAEVYKRLAFMDELTGLYNRTAYQRDVEMMDREHAVVVMIDLNDLKRCNDEFGHEYGDQYISIAGKMIEETFGLDGRCYRIGGDEFCVLLSGIDQRELDNHLLVLQNRMKKANQKGFVVPVALAVGYGFFDEKDDQSLEDTRNRADLLMYEEKRRMKQE